MWVKIHRLWVVVVLTPATSRLIWLTWLGVSRVGAVFDPVVSGFADEASVSTCLPSALSAPTPATPVAPTLAMEQHEGGSVELLGS